MASRPLAKHQVIKDGNMSGNLTSDVTVIENLSMVSYECSWNGSSPIGTVTVEVSNDYALNADGSVRNAGTWTSLAISGAVANNVDSGYIDILGTSAYAIRLKYTRSSGSGTFQAFLQSKVS